MSERIYTVAWVEVHQATVEADSFKGAEAMAKELGRRKTFYKYVDELTTTEEHGHQEANKLVNTCRKGLGKYAT